MARICDWISFTTREELDSEAPDWPQRAYDQNR